MKKVLLIMLLALVLFPLAAPRLIPAFITAGTDKYELALESNEKAKEAQDEKEAKEDKKKYEDLFHPYTPHSSFSGKTNLFRKSGVDLCRDPYLPYLAPPPDRC
jgi:hypothetical protein